MLYRRQWSGEVEMAGFELEVFIYRCDIDKNDYSKLLILPFSNNVSTPYD